MGGDQRLVLVNSFARSSLVDLKIYQMLSNEHPVLKDGLLQIKARVQATQSWKAFDVILCLPMDPPELQKSADQCHFRSTGAAPSEAPPVPTEAPPPVAPRAPPRRSGGGGGGKSPSTGESVRGVSTAREPQSADSSPFCTRIQSFTSTFFKDVLLNVA